MSHHPVLGEQSYNQELWIVKKDTIYFAINALSAALDYMRLYRKTIPEDCNTILSHVDNQIRSIEKSLEQLKNEPTEEI